jgi:N-acetylglucosaminyldiphosphoundecaprenol N-acetyl-beta-D-mannosaminyltransferase
MEQKRIELLNTPIDKLTMKETIEIIDSAIKAKKTIQHIVVNVAKIVLMQKDNSLYDSVVSSDIINADGQAVVWAAKFLGKPLPERVAGVDLFQNLVKLAAERGYRPFFFGAKEEVLQKLVNKFQVMYPDLKIAGYRNGYFEKTDEKEREIARLIRESKADMLFIAFGTPHKEKFLAKWQSYMEVPFAMGVGGSFDVVSGITKRAPVWMQKAGMEWFYRILQEPRRMWKRYAKTNPVFVYLVLKEKYRLIFANN